MKRIIFQTGKIAFSGFLNDTQAAREVFDNLPVSSEVSRWGKEIYFNLGFKVSSHSATMDIGKKDIAYWPQGKSLCVFYGPTPSSEEEDKPVPASPVVVVGKVDASPSDLDKVTLGQQIKVGKA